MAPPEKQGSRLGDILTRLKLVTDEQVETALEFQSKSGKLFGESLLALGYVGEDDLSWALSSQLGLPFVAVAADMADPQMIAQFPPDFLRRNLVLPLVASDTTLSVVLADPTDEVTLARLERMSGYQLNVAVGTPAAINRALDSMLGEEPVSDTVAKKTPSSAPGTFSSPELAKLLDRAFTQGASSVHLDPEGEKVRVRFRTRTGSLIEGGWYETDSLNELVEGLRCWLGTGTMSSPGIQIWDSGPDGEEPLPFCAVAVEGEGGTSLTLALEATVPGRDKLSAPFEEEWTRFDELMKRPSGLIIAVAPTDLERQQLLGRILGNLDASKRRACAMAGEETPLPRGMLRFGGETCTDSARTLAKLEGIDVLAGVFDTLEPASFLTEAGGQGTLVIAVFPGNSVLGCLSRLLEEDVSATLLSESLLAVVGQRVIPGVDENASRRAITETLFVEDPVRRALQDGGNIEGLRQAAQTQGFVEIAVRARTLKSVDYRVIEDLERHRFLEDAA